VATWKPKLPAGSKKTVTNLWWDSSPGQTAPKGRRMGHAGAIIGGADDTAAAKMKIMRECRYSCGRIARRNRDHHARALGRSLRIG